MRLLLIGDIVGKGGRRAVVSLAPQLRNELGCGFVAANGENMAGGGGLNRKCLTDLCGVVDAVTTGDHVWDQRDFVTEVTEFPTVLRPANLPPVQPGRGWGVFTGPDGLEVAVISLLGRTFMTPGSDCPFRTADAILAELAGRTRLVLVDIHAEATSEKTALARYLDGRVTAVLGTHTHVATADEQVLPGGTAFQCDVGMVGARESILGRAIPPVVRRFVTGMPAPFTVVESGIRLHATWVEADPATGRATAIGRVARDWAEPA
ncbi:MAG: TIGR00282 family metallophosphoesterase [Lentisphaeria bacterium]